MYKIAWPTRNASDAGAAMRRIGVPYTDAPAENCGSLVWGTTLLPGKSASTCAFELHFVEGPNLAGADIAASWERYFHNENAGMNTFNAFMHNTVTMYVPHVGPLVTALQASGTAFMERKSFSGATEWHHVLVELGASGRVVEIVGRWDKQTARVDIETWGDHECAEAHAVQFDNSTLEDAYYGSAWGDEKIWQPMTVGLSIASTEPLEAARWFASRMPLTGATITDVYEGGSCDVVTLGWTQAPMMSIRLVHNKAAPSSRFTVGDHDARSRARRGVLGVDNPGRWDNWLDQHIGLETLFLDSDVPAKRLTPHGRGAREHQHAVRGARDGRERPWRDQPEHDDVRVHVPHRGALHQPLPLRRVEQRAYYLGPAASPTDTRVGSCSRARARRAAPRAAPHTGAHESAAPRASAPDLKFGHADVAKTERALGPSARAGGSGIAAPPPACSRRGARPASPSSRPAPPWPRGPWPRRLLLGLLLRLLLRLLGEARGDLAVLGRLLLRL